MPKHRVGSIGRWGNNVNTLIPPGRIARRFYIPTKHWLYRSNAWGSTVHKDGRGSGVYTGLDIQVERHRSEGDGETVRTNNGGCIGTTVEDSKNLDSQVRKS